MNVSANLLAVNQQVRDARIDWKVIQRARELSGLAWAPAEQNAIKLMLEAARGAASKLEGQS